ncbi:hypothetical protein NONI108955_15830 [Nocardia ninae]|uniref:DUF8176 domain-containing protein n=1 Tax=Nocardia ninae NBRC 108245 TaxID=1210091 RepID=A0A511MA97_9NOCA|nr:hypothetical protein [Nocardia ninae]GEM37107.1 hypothetical protein NN4_16260 [Nocardia ninae NBRC 108245]
MTSDGDPRENESDDQSASDFGPPVGEFGPPVSEFGPPVSEFGPPMGDTGPRWQVPEQTADHPELVWRPAADAGPTPPPQYRAPDSAAVAEPPPGPPPVPPRVPAADREQPARPAGDPDKDSWWNRPTDTGSVPKPPPLSAPGLSWADDPIAKRLAPTTPVVAPPTPRQSGSHTGRNVIAGILALVILVGLTVTVIMVSRNTGGDTAAPPAATTTAALSCPATKDGKVTVGNGSGDATSGPEAILGFQYSFYVERSGERARSFVAPDAENVSPADVIQKGINEEVPVGTTHCVRITEVATDTFDVDLTEHHPDGKTRVYPQTVTTVLRDGKVQIYAIRERALS